MYLKYILTLMFLFSKSIAFQCINLNRLRPSYMTMRLKKSLSANYDSVYPNEGNGSKVSRKSKSLAPVYRPRSVNQRQYVSYIDDNQVPIVLGVGPAGCGKTLFACVSAIEGLKSGTFQKIILTRPIVPVEEEELGFLPGTLVKKMDPWTRPLMDIFLEYYPQHELDFMIGAGVIEISPLAYMRGRTFKRSFIVADEMQNSSPGQMLMLTTRIGEGSKMVITGDLKQSDRGLDNGLFDFMNKIKEFRSIKNCDVDSYSENCTFGIEMVEMNKGDIERSPIVSKILEIYNPKPIQFLKDFTKPIITKTLNVGDLESTCNECSSDDEIEKNKKVFVGDAALIPIQHISKK